MSSYIVMYDLCEPGQDYSKIIGAINDMFPNSVRITKSCWLINTTVLTKRVRDYLKLFIDDNDILAVIKLGDDWATTGVDKQASDWLTTHV